MADSGDYCIFVFDLPEDRESIMEIFQDQFHFHKTDARVRLRHLPGMIPDRYSRERALELVQALSPADCHAKVIEYSKLPDLRRAAQLHHVRCKAEGFALVNRDGEKEDILPWESMDFISVGAIPSSTVDGGTTINPVSSKTDHADPLTHPEKFSRELWVIAEKGSRCFRIEEHEMNYEYLGDRIAPSSKQNFESLVRDIHENAPHLLVMGTTREFLERRPLKQYCYSTPDAFRQLVAGQVAVVLGLTTA